jgi:hypothetical protein
MFAPPHAAVGDEEDLQLAPPHRLAPRLGRRVRGPPSRWGLVFGDRTLDRFGLDGCLALPANPAQQVAAADDVALLEAGADERCERASDAVGDRRGGPG